MNEKLPNDLEIRRAQLPQNYESAKLALKECSEVDEAMEWAERILSLAPRDVRNLKEILYRSFYMSPLEGAAFARALEQNLQGMEDSIEGPLAFSEKRKPTFKNK